MKILVDINETDLQIALVALRTSREYVKAILGVAEKSSLGCGPEERVELLARSNALDRARLALLDYRPAEVISTPADNLDFLPRGAAQAGAL